MGSLLPVDPVDVFGSIIGAVVGRIVMFFVALWVGFAVGGFSALLVDFGDIFTLENWTEPVAALPYVPLTWGGSLILGFLNPFVALVTLGYFYFAYALLWTEKDVVKLLGCTVVLEAVRSYLCVGWVGGEDFINIGWGVIFLTGLCAAMVAGAWTLSRTMYEGEMRRLEEIAAENAAKREAKERGAREMAAEDEAARERLRRG